LVALFVVSTSGFALTGSKTADLSQKTVAPVINITIDLGDITDLTSNEVAVLINESINICIPEQAALQCSVTLKSSVKTLVVDMEISVTVSGDCSQVRAEAMSLLHDIVAWAKSFI